MQNTTVAQAVLRFAICDDEQAQRAYLAGLVRAWAAQSGHKPAIACYASAEQYLFEREDTQPADVLFLDIQMEGMNGVALAEMLRARGDDIQIVFVTGFPDFVQQGYDVSALHYLIKPIDEAKLYSVLDRAAQALARKAAFLLIETAEGLLKLYERDILCVEALGRESLFHCSEARHTARMTLGAAQGLLSPRFIQCHRSYLVNLDGIRAIERTQIVLDNGQPIALSRRLYRQVNEAFIAHYRR